MDTDTTGNGQRKIIIEAKQSAHQAGLRYVTDDRPGIRRCRAGGGFMYLTPEGERLRDAVHVERIKSLAIPPAWEKVWVCPLPHGHLQATGRDDRGRKQYRYHPDWRSVRDGKKYHRMIDFGKALPAIRRRVGRDLRKHGLPREKVLAAVVYLLDATGMRIGNEAYTKENKSYGLTTLRCRHADVGSRNIEFTYVGKSGMRQHIKVTSRRLATILKRCQELPGQELLQYANGDGERHGIESHDVNDYLHEIAGADFTAKDFRTWHGTVEAALALAEMEPCESQTQGKKSVVAAIKHVAEQLGNRPATCRKYYVHPAVTDAYLSCELHAAAQGASGGRPGKRGLRPGEKLVMKLLQKSARSRA